MSRKPLSIGMNCQAAHQIRRCFPRGETYFFDWIVSAPEAVRRWLAGDVDLLNPELVRYNDARRVSVLDGGSGLAFYGHDLPTDAAGMIVPDYKDALPLVREKYLRRAERTRALLGSGEPLLLVRNTDVNSEEVNPDAIRALIADFERAFPSGDFHYLFVTHGPVSEPANTPGVYIAQVEPGATWKGDDASWTAAFARAGVAALLGDDERVVREHYAHVSPIFLAEVMPTLEGSPEDV